MTTNEFVPNVVLIEDITNEQHAVVTFTTDHNFVLNEYISLRVSRPYGMKEINNRRGKVLGLTSDTVTLDIDSINFTPFVVPGDLAKTTPPCAVPSSSGVNLAEYSPTMILNDCFDNRLVE